MFIIPIRKWVAGLFLSVVITLGIPQSNAQDTPAGCGDGCADLEGCGESSCGESCTLDPHELFNKFAGDDSIFAELKGQKLGGMTYSVGGELRHRFMNEDNRLRPPGGNAEYSLWRLTTFLDLKVNDRVGAFVEGIDASAWQEGDAPYSRVGIDVNRLDFLRYYGELTLLKEKDYSLKYRYGRQFLKYGAQRLLSPLGWSNTYRNFEGHKLLYSGSNWNIDGFHMKSVNAAAGGSGFNTNKLDSPDNDRTISGIYSTYKGLESSTLDLYWLHFDEENASVARHDGNRHTLGMRLAGSQAIKECDKLVGTWAWDLEGAYQFGNDNFGGVNKDVSAGMAAATLGYTFNEAKWTPSLKAFYYWSSGGDPNGGTNNTFYTMYPLGHAYWGLIDNFSGQNMHDVGLTASMKPHKKLSLALSYHHFEKADDADNVYNIVGAPIGVPNGNSNLGNEIDLLATIPVTKNFNVQAGYFWFFYGDALASRTNDARQFYLQTSWKF